MESRSQHSRVGSVAAPLPSNTVFRLEGSRPGFLEPDATLTGTAGDQRFAILLEYDRTSKAHKQIADYAATITGF